MASPVEEEEEGRKEKLVASYTPGLQYFEDRLMLKRDLIHHLEQPTGFAIHDVLTVILMLIHEAISAW